MKYVYMVLIGVLAGFSTFEFMRATTAVQTVGVVRLQLKGVATAKEFQIGTLGETVSNYETTISNLQMRLDKNRLESADEAKALKASLSEAEAQIANLENEKRLRDTEHASYLSQVPKPTIYQDGSARRPMFDKVIGRGGGTLMRHAFFAQVYGRKVLFRNPDVLSDAKVFDVDDLHPLMLEYISVDADAAKADQRRSDYDLARNWQITSSQMLLDRQAQAISAAAAAEAQAKINAENRKAAAEEAKALAAIETERIKANAAMVAAQKPPNQINMIQQQSVQQSQRRTPRGYTLINDTWIPYY